MFFSVPNTAALSVSPLEAPWEAVKTMGIPDTLETKDAYTRWVNDPHTKNCFFSAFEGLAPALRVSDGNDNPPYKMHALVVDYDAPFVEETHLQFLMNGKWATYPPAYYAVTFSNHLRLVWLFEAPVLVTGTEHIRAFMQHIKREFKLIKWHSGLDAAALGNPALYYQIGRRWGELYPESRIPTSVLHLWMYEASKKLRLQPDQQVKIPLEDVYEEIQAQFPGKWTGPFTPGRQSVRFWDPSADNSTGAWLREDGFVCFTGNEPFVSWSRLLGKKFVERYEADFLARFRERSVYCKGRFYIHVPDLDEWHERNKDDFSLWLRVNGIDPARRGAATCSQVDLIENDIMEHKRIHGVAPCIHFPKGLVVIEGKKYLNTATHKVLQPAPPCTPGPMSFIDGKKWFPFLYEYFKTLFVLPDDEKADPQLEHLMAWMKRFYVGALEQNPKQGQAIVMAGHVGKGKDFFSTGILGTLMGGVADASGYLTGENKDWTGSLAQPVWAINDEMGSTDYHIHRAFSAKVKRFVASPAMEWNAKYQNVEQTPWFGRIVITCNVDSESLRILPDMDMNTLDKIMLFKASSHVVAFGERDENTAILQRELPYFARFLLDWHIPDYLLAEKKRFGIVSFHHPDILEEAHQRGASTVLLDMLHPFLAEYAQLRAKEPGGSEEWVGTAVQLYGDLCVKNPATAREFKCNTISTLLGVLMQKGYNIKKTKARDTRQVYWSIPFKLRHIAESKNFLKSS